MVSSAQEKKNTGIPENRKRIFCILLFSYSLLLVLSACGLKGELKRPAEITPQEKAKQERSI